MANIKKQKGPDKLNIWLNKHYRLASWIVFAAVLLLVGYFILWPRYQSTRELSESFVPAQREKLQTLDQYEVKIGELEDLAGQIERNYSQSLRDLEYILPAKAQLPELIAQLDQLTRQSGLIIINLDILESTDQSKSAKEASEKDKMVTGNKNLQAIDINLTVRGGDYPVFKRFLDKLEKHIRLLDLTSIGFASARGDQGSYSLNLKTYYLRDL